MSVNSEINRLQTAHNALRQRANTFTNSTGDVRVSEYVSTMNSYLEAMEDLSSEIPKIMVFDFGDGFKYGGSNYFNDSITNDVVFRNNYTRHYVNTHKIIIFNGKPYVLFMMVKNEDTSDTNFMEAIKASGNIHGFDTYQFMYGLVSYEGLQQMLQCEYEHKLPTWNGNNLSFLCPFRYLLQFDGSVYIQCSNNTYHTIDAQRELEYVEKRNYFFYEILR